MFFTYVLENEEKDFYIGYTSDLKRRLKEYNQSKTFSTKGHIWKCVYYEACLDDEDARRREGYFKTTQGRRLLKRRLKEYLYKRRAS